jgi:hypothetical protein
MSTPIRQTVTVHIFPTGDDNPSARATFGNQVLDREADETFAAFVKRTYAAAEAAGESDLTLGDDMADPGFDDMGG